MLEFAPGFGVFPIYCPAPADSIPADSPIKGCLQTVSLDELGDLPVRAITLLLSGATVPETILPAAAPFEAEPVG